MILVAPEKTVLMDYVNRSCDPPNDGLVMGGDLGMELNLTSVCLILKD